jgi:hypothetical protein
MTAEYLLPITCATRKSRLIFVSAIACAMVCPRGHATPAEVAAMRQPGRALVLIKFPHRQKHAQQVEEYHKLLRDDAAAVSVVTVCTCVWLKQPRSRWFTIVDGDNALIERAKHFAHILNRIEGCRSYVFSGQWTESKDQIRMDVRLRSERVLPDAAALERTGTAQNICPECGHQFKGKGFDGIDAHWRAKHEAIMPYRKAWLLLKAGTYRR